MIILFIVLWILLYVIAAAMGLQPAIKARKNGKNKKPFLSIIERNACICTLVLMVFIGAHIALWFSDFKNNPNTAINAMLLKHYFIGLLLSIIWPPHFVVFFADVVIVLLSSKREREYECIMPRVGISKRTGVGVSFTFVFLFCTCIVLFYSSIISTFVFFSLLLIELIALSFTMFFIRFRRGTEDASQLHNK